MTKNNLNLGSTAFIALTSAYFAIALNIKFWQFACEKIDINSFSVLFFALSLPFTFRCFGFSACLSFPVSASL